MVYSLLNTESGILGAKMARRERPFIKNFIELPRDAVFDFLGRGLKGRNDDEQPKLELDIGAGLEWDGSTVKLKIGKGCKFDDDFLSCDFDEDEELRSTFTTLTDLSLEVDGCWLMINKKYTVYELRRTRHGVLKDIVSVGDSYDTDGVLIPIGHDGYGGYGQLSLLSSTRESTPEMPNFYKLSE
jgi:hypothetical protein